MSDELSESARPGDGGIVGLFVNGETLFPHSTKRDNGTQLDYPVAEVIGELFEFASRFGEDVRERVLVRNWDDPPVSGPYSLLMADLQRRLFQLVHVPSKAGGSPSQPTLAQREEQIAGEIARRAGNWANRTLDVAGGRPVTVVMAGQIEDPEMPDGVNVVRLPIRQEARDEAAPQIIDADPSHLAIHHELWPA